MSLPFRIPILALACVVMTCGPLRAADRYVANSGDDAGLGDASQPWRTLTHAAASLQPGDTVWVAPGTYPERVSTVRGGTSEAGRVAFRSQGGATLRGFRVSHPYVTVEGFDFTGHAAADVLDGHIVATSGADHFEFLNNTVRDGIYAVRPDFTFLDRTITSPSATFVADRFEPGQIVSISRATNSSAPLNLGSWIIESVTETTLALTEPLAADGPVPAYLTASDSYGLVLMPGTESCVVRSNTFRNLSYDCWFIAGTNHVLEANLLTETHGWDAMHFMGPNHVFRGNLIHSSPLVVYQNSPDVFENYPSIPYENVLFEHNFVWSFPGVLCSQKGTLGNMVGLTFRNNVFIDVGRFVIRNPGTVFENNTFLYVAAQSTPVSAPAPHALRFLEFRVDDLVVKNNLFVGCGEGRDADAIGWYEFDRLPARFDVTHNFVAGPPPLFASKSGFVTSDPSLNGGDPGFVNLDDPLGPDGLPFTDDDGLRLRPESPLKNAGMGGVELGAYNTAQPRPSLQIDETSADALALSWPSSSEGYSLQSATHLGGPWSTITEPAVLEGDHFVVYVTADQVQFFRLVR